MQDQDVQNFYLISSKPSTHSNDKLQLKKKQKLNIQLILSWSYCSPSLCVVCTMSPYIN